MRLLCPWDSPGKNTGVGFHPLLQGTLPTQGSKIQISHISPCNGRQILYHLSHLGSTYWGLNKGLFVLVVVVGFFFNELRLYM